MSDREKLIAAEAGQEVAATNVTGWWVTGTLDGSVAVIRFTTPSGAETSVCFPADQIDALIQRLEAAREFLAVRRSSTRN